MKTWLLPKACCAVKTLTSLLDGITQRILEEAKDISMATGTDGTDAAAPPEGSTAKPLTSLDIHKASGEESGECSWIHAGAAAVWPPHTSQLQRLARRAPTVATFSIQG